jgi:transcription elongation factor GreA
MMTDESETILTRAGYEKLQNELDYLVNEEAVEVAERLADARSDVDFGEDTTFLEIMAEKTRIEDRIAQLKLILFRARVVDEDLDPDSATPGDRVVVLDMEYDEELAFDLLDSAEVSHGRQGVSIASPVGKALLGKKIGDVVEVKVPDGAARYKILRFEEIPD